MCKGTQEGTWSGVDVGVHGQSRGNVQSEGFYGQYAKIETTPSTQDALSKRFMPLHKSVGEFIPPALPFHTPGYTPNPIFEILSTLLILHARFDIGCYLTCN